MAPASGPVGEPKLDPARTMEDQGTEPTEIVVGTPPFSSPDPATDGLKMLPLEDGTSAYEARQQGGEESDPESMKAADFKKMVSDATNQEELDAAAQAYADSGKEFSTVEDAIEKKQQELDAA